MLIQPLLFHFKEQNFWLSTQRCVFWEEQKTLILSDPHFGKTGHFRKSGIAVPQHVYKEDLHRLFHVIQHFQPQKVLITGDFFHSSSNKEINYFIKWRKDISHLDFILIKGNHDILPQHKYKEAGIEIHDELMIKNFCFTHDINNCQSNAEYTFSGHIHPGIKISGLARQSLRLPCFYFTPQYAVLPAFSLFTGLAAISPKNTDQIFAVTEKAVIPIG